MQTLFAQLEFTQLAWLAGLASLVLLFRFADRSLTGFSRPRQVASTLCRALVVLAVVAALCDIRNSEPTTEKFVVLAVDQSASIPAESRLVAEKFLDEAFAAVGNNRVALLPFAVETSGLFDARSGETTSLECQGTNLATAVEVASALIPAHYVPHVVLLTDGVETEGDVIESARSAGVPISTLPLESRRLSYLYASSLQTKPQVRPGVPFDVEVAVRSSSAAEGTIRLLKDDRQAGNLDVSIAEGDNRFRFPQTIDGEAVARFAVELDGFGDSLTGADAALGPVFASAAPRVLLVDSDPRSARSFVEALEAAQIEVDVRRPQEVPSRDADLRQFDLVVLSNVPAEALNRQQVDRLVAYVSDFGAGLIVVGGYRSLTSGGYHETALEEILPVECVFEEDRQRPDLAMVLVIDRSSSMKGRAIELAKDATRRAVELLNPKDQVGIIAFEDDSRWISPIEICSNKQEVLSRIDGITAGGGTEVYTALDKAYLALDEAFAERKHMIVLSDGISHPAEFERLASEIVDAGITISTVAVGREAGAEVLKELARIGRGQYYYCDDPKDVPRVFALETASASKLGIIEKPFYAEAVGTDPEFAELDLSEAPRLLGYVETRARPDAQVLLASEEGDPVLARRRYGKGEVVVFASDVQNRWAAAWLRWPGFGPFWDVLVRRTMRKVTPKELSLSIRRQDDRREVSVELVDVEGTTKDDSLETAGVALAITDPSGTEQTLAADCATPGRYTADAAAVEPGAYFALASQSHHGRPTAIERRRLEIPPTDELRIKPTNHDLLNQIAELTGGLYNPKPADIFALPADPVQRTTDFWHLFLAAAAVLLVIDVAIRRTARR